MDIDPNTKIAQEIQQKFEFYLLALTFTFLGFSVQTGEFGESSFAAGAEVLGWIGLLVSGVVGFWRLEWVPVNYNIHAELDTLRDELKQCEALQSKGVQQVPVADVEGTHSVEELIKKKKAQIEKHQGKSEKIEKHSICKYRTQKVCFVFGFVLIILARAWSPICQVTSAVIASGSR